MVLLRCYPTITDWVNHMLGTDLSFPLYSFGFFVAMGFVGGAVFLHSELKRRAELGLFSYNEKILEEGKPATPYDLLWNAVLGFVLGFKGLGIVLDYATFTMNPQAYMLSDEGHLIGGIVGAIVLAGWTYWSKERQRKDPPVERKVRLYPHDQVGDVVIVAAIAGVFGANVFFWFESPGNFHDFLNNPLESFFSGLTIYGGLVFGGLGLIWYAWRKKMHIGHLFDSLGPAFMIAYAIGRIGCQVSGDGDWGIVNNMAAPGWLPDWLWADHYAHNIHSQGVPIPGCVGDHCRQLAEPRFPTPIYETVGCTLLFASLWAVRKRITAWPGMLFGLFLIFNGAERFLIEKIRVNTVLPGFGLNWTQAEYVAVLLVLAGAGLMLWTYLRKPALTPKPPG